MSGRPKIILLCFAGLLLILPSAQCQTPALAITGTLSVPANGMVVAELTGGTATCAWLIQPNPVSQEHWAQKVAFSGPSGSYQVICLAVYGQQPVILQATATIAGALPGPPLPGPVPPVPPSPTPPPPSPPTPVPAGPLWAIAIFDTSQQSTLPVGQLAIWTSQTLQPSLSSLKVYLRRVDINNPSLSSAGWQKVLTGLTPPILAIVDSDAKVTAQPLPANEAGVLAAVKLAQGTQ